MEINIKAIARAFSDRSLTDVQKHLCKIHTILARSLKYKLPPRILKNKTSF